MKAPEELLVKVMGILAEKYKNQLVLHGGMVLRLLNSPRSTQDLDYFWVRTKRRNLFGKELKTVLEKIEGIQVTSVSSKSRGVFLDVEDQLSKQKIKIEISVEEKRKKPPIPLTTASLANLYSLKTHIISVMDLSEGFSQKIGACLERNLCRDLYDLVQFEPLTSFDEPSLRERLSILQVRRAKPQKVSFGQAAQMLRKRTEDLTSQKIAEELGSWLSKEQLAGIEIIIKATIERIAQKMEKII